MRSLRVKFNIRRFQSPAGVRRGEIEKVRETSPSVTNISCPQNQHALAEISMKMARENEPGSREKLTRARTQRGFSNFHSALCIG